MISIASRNATDGAAHSRGIFEQCLRQATVLAPAMMGELLSKAEIIIRTRQSAATELPARMAMGEAADGLARHKDLLIERFPDVLDKTMAQALRGGMDNAVKPLAVAPLRFDQLELMDDAQIQDRIDTARMQQAATQGCERELSELDALVCAARGFANVQLDRNPFRPQIVGAALMEVLTMVPSTPEQRAVWMQSLGGSLGEQLRRLYQQLADFLRNQQVQSASYIRVGSAGPDAMHDGGGAEVASHADAFEKNAPYVGPRGNRVENSRLTVSQLRQVLGSDYFPHGSQAAAIEQDLEAVGALVQQLSSSSYNADQSLSSARLGVESELHTSRANALSVYEVSADENDAEVDDGVAQDVVRMMVDNLCDDQRLMQVVRDWVGRLEPPLLALAAVDVGFLNDKSHPARLLLDEVTARSLGFADEAAEGFHHFFDPVLAASAELLPHAMPDAQPFVQAWQAVESAWSKQKSTAQLKSGQAMQALLQAEQRNLLAEKIALELTRRDDARLAPIFVKQFVAGPWAQVLAQTRLSPAMLQAAQDYLDAVAELLWSVVPEQASRNKPRLVRMIPRLLSTIRTGLAVIGSPVNEGDAFFSQLMKVHEAALKTGLPRRAGVKSKTGENQLQRVEQPIRADDAVWLAPQEERDSGFLDERDFAAQSTLPMLLADELAAAGALSTPATALPDELDGLLIIEPPVLGSWVEFLSNDRWVRTQLTWASPHGTLFMFTGAAGNPTSMTRRALDKMQAKQTMRIITQDSVVVGALNAVAQTAMRNTINPQAQ